MPVLEHDPHLLNVYHAYIVNPARHARVRAAQAERFVAFLVSPETQRAIGEFGQVALRRAAVRP